MSKSLRAVPVVLCLSLFSSCGRPDGGYPEPDGDPRAPSASGSAPTNREIVEAIERLRAETSAIRRLLERGTPGGAASAAELGPPVPSGPIADADWDDLERAAEARLVIEHVGRYKARLIPDLLAAETAAAAGPQPVQVHTIENGVPVLREETIDTETLGESVEWHKKVLAALARVRTIEDLARWRNEFEIEALE